MLETGTNARVKGIEVCAYETGDGAVLEGLYGSCIETNPAGEYALLGLSAGTYVVEFTTPFGSQVNYVTRYFNEATLAGEVTPIKIEANTIRTEIGALLHHGGRVAGRVTSAATDTPIEGIVPARKVETQKVRDVPPPTAMANTRCRDSPVAHTRSASPRRPKVDSTT